MNSSLSYEVLLYLNKYYFIMLMFSEIGIVVFKTINLPYPTGTLITECFMLILLACTESVRIFMGHKGNLTEKTFFVIVSIVLTVPSMLGMIYFIVWQTYVLRLELILGTIQLTMQGIEMILAIVCLMRFCKARTY